MNNKVINIIDPVTRQVFLNGIYNKPFWEIELKVLKPSEQSCQTKLNANNMAFANVTDQIKPLSHNYNTRSKAFTNDNKTSETDNKNEHLETTIHGVVTSDKYSTLTSQKKSVKSDCESRPDFLTSFRDREFLEVNQIPEVELTEKETELLQEAKIQKSYKKAVLWHVRFGHASTNYLKKLQQSHLEMQGIKGCEFDEAVRDCEVCKIAKIKKKPFKNVRARANKPLQVINADIMGQISPSTFPKGYKYISVFIDNYLRLAMAYLMKSKTQTGQCLEAFIISCRNLRGEDDKFCYLDTDQGTEFTGGYTRIVLDKFNAELRLACPDTPQHNGVAEKFNQTIQGKVRAYMYDSKLPSNMWDLAVYAATYAYN